MIMMADPRGPKDKVFQKATQGLSPVYHLFMCSPQDKNALSIFKWLNKNPKKSSKYFVKNM